MKSLEIQKQLKMSYDELIKYFLVKYGSAQYDYFRNELCKSKNPKVSRASEGLVCHHIDEDKAILLSNDKWAASYPFEYQKADRLVYCNILEHLILHIKIVEECENLIELQGVGGAVSCICPQINDYFNGYNFKQQYFIVLYSLIEGNFKDYISVLHYFLDALENKPLHRLVVSKERLSLGWNRQIVEKVYNEL